MFARVPGRTLATCLATSSITVTTRPSAAWCSRPSRDTRARPAPCDLGLVPLGRALIWWTVDAESERDALRLLPPYVVERTTITHVSEGDPMNRARKGWYG